MATAPPSVRILHVEDNVADAELVRLLLRRRMPEVEVFRVDDLPSLYAALETGRYDAVLCDYNLPSLRGSEVFSHVRQEDPDVPFIFVSGTIGEDRAADLLRNGATDYVLKDRLDRLPHAIERALGEARQQIRARELEAQFLHSQKMEAVGRLAGGIAHDFNNLLTVMNSFSELVLEKTDSGDPRRPELEEALLAGRRAASLTGRLLAFSRRQVREPVTLDLNGVVESIRALLERLLPLGITLEVRTTAGPLPVHADAGQLEQVLVNLAVNARDSMPSGGAIRVETGTATLPDGAPGELVTLSVSDRGTGIPPEVREHLFEPFFTTKPRGQGTGLGLSTVHGIVSQNGGRIEVDSAPGRGSTFRVIFPRSVRPVAPAVTGAATLDPVRRGTTVLVVDDNAMILRLAGLILADAGYRVLSAADSDEALRAADGHAGEIDLLLTDVGIRPLRGPKLAEELHRRRPGTRVLFMSGDGPDSLGTGEPMLLSKPFTLESLKAKVALALQTSAS